MAIVNMHAAKTQLSRLVEDAVGGDEVIIARNGTPLVRLVPVVARSRRSGFGDLKGKIRIADDFDAPLPPDVLRAFGIEP